MKEIESILENFHYENRINFTEKDFGRFVITGLINGENSIYTRIGKVVQVRKEAGAFGSDTVFLRYANKVLGTSENNSYYAVSDSDSEIIKKWFGEIDLIDKPGDAYCIRGEFTETGFIIPSKIKEGETTPMREVVQKIKNILDEK